MKSRHVVIAIALLVAVGAGAFVYRLETSLVLSSAEQTFAVRASLIQQYIRLMRQNVYALEHAIESRFEQIERSGTRAPQIEAIRFHSEYDVWGVSGLESESGVPELSGTLTGLDSLSDPTARVEKELTAVLYNDSQFRTLLDNIPDIIWVYYTSKNDFIYIAPDPAIADFRFSEVVHTKEFWTQAIPGNNPDLEQIISDLYDDYYGQGLMISISSPVVLDGAFAGVASLDLGIDLLRELSGVGSAAGESILIDENDRIVARFGDFELTEAYDVPSRPGWTDNGGDAYWLSTEVSAGELRLLHRLPKRGLIWTVVGQSILYWAVFAAMFGLVVFSVRLNEALSRVKVLMNRDALTGLLNRRGFESTVRRQRTAIRYEGQRTALMLMDIDHFKDVNDTYGHDKGDEVLVAIARRLSAGIKEYDLACRWGGEELVLMLVFDDPELLQRIADRLRNSIADRPVSSRDLHVTVSGGLTIWEWDEHLDAAIARADKLLYRAKAGGRNRIETDISTA